MNDDIQDAQVDPSPTNEETQNIEGQVADSSQADMTQASPSTQPDANQGAVPNGLPPKENLYGEFRRKIFEEVVPIIQGTVREAMLGQQHNGQPQQAPEVKYQGKYSAHDLENILRHPEASEQDKHFANRGLAYIEARQDMLKDLDTRQEKTTAQSRNEQALRAIVSDYPQVFNPQTNSWNFSDPLFQKAMQFYNSEPRLQSFGNEGIRVAMDRAYAEMARTGQAVIKKTQVKLNAQQRQIEKNQSQALSAGTLTPGKQTGTETSKAKIMEAWRKNPEDPTLKQAALTNLVPKSWFD